MESWEEYEASQRTYTEMLAEAKKIHPDMEVRLDLIDHQKWEMFMPTNFIERYGLPESFKGTPAWDMEQERDSGYDNQLQRYRHKNGFDCIPLEGVAEYVNLSHEENTWGSKIRDEKLKEDGIVIDWKNWKEVSDEDFAKYKAHHKEAERLCEIEFAEKRKMLQDKYGI